MSAVGGQPPITVGDALADSVETRRGPASPWVEALHELGAIDRAVYEAVARTPTEMLDGPMRRLSEAANYSRLWLGMAAAMALLGGQRGRRGALEGVVAIGVTSAAVNLGFKQIHRRRRPTRDDAFPGRQVKMPKSTSFPSGHAASAFAFAYAVGRNLPVLALPIRVMALGVAYSRVHIGVHYPGDVAVGSVIGGANGAFVAAVFDRLPARRAPFP